MLSACIPAKASYTLASTKTHSGRDPTTSRIVSKVLYMIYINTGGYNALLGVPAPVDAAARLQTKSPPNLEAPWGSPTQKTNNQHLNCRNGQHHGANSPCRTTVAMVVSKLAEIDPMKLSIMTGTWQSTWHPKPLGIQNRRNLTS